MNYVDRLREPEHTGQNRCWPCTLVNLCLLAAVSLVLALRDRRLAAIATAFAGVAAIALRGYVVPYTPQFAPRLVAASPLPDDLFKRSVADADERDSLTASSMDGETVLAELVAAGVVEADGEVIRPVESVDTAWRDEMAHLARLPPAELADRVRETFPALSAVDTFSEDDTDWLVVGTGHGELLPHPVAVAELAAYRALGDTVADEQLRLAGARAFRMFLDTCPVCETKLELSSAVSCCGGYTDPHESPDETLVCPACRQRVATIPAE